MATIKKELGPLLSTGSHLVLPEDEHFESVSKRWNCRFPIKYSAIVDASCEEDVAATIKYSNKNNLPFLAFNGTHGAQLPLLNFQDGIGITTLSMKSFTISEDDGGATAWFRGSWLSGHVKEELFKIGKRTTHGSCDSTGLIGPMLGGGHGLMQGHYGLLADQIVEMRVVLADGSIVSVSESSNADLFWAMRGAGHNFGIVTAVKYKIYDVPKDDVWTHSSIIFAGSKLESLVDVFNTILATQPVELTVWLPHFIRLPHIDASDPVIMIQVLYEGHESENPLLAPLAVLDPLEFKSKPISWLQATESIDWGWTSLSNQKSVASLLRFPLGMNTFDGPSMRKAYNHFAAVTAAQPAFAYSFIVWEAYSTHGVKAVADDATAVADRGDNMLVAPIIIYLGQNPALDEEAENFGVELRRLLLEGQKGQEVHAYVNYAHGNESLEQVYGHQAWRLDKLRRLKAEYDPHNVFGYYAPIT